MNIKQKRADVCRSPPAGHRFFSADAHTVVKTSRAHEVLKWDTAGVQHCNCGPIKTSVCVCVCMFAAVPAP